MKIGIIGAGNIGGVLTRRLQALGYDVAVANSRGPGSLAELAAETGATAATIEDVTKERDVVVVAIPMFRIPELSPSLFHDVPVVIDTSNYYPRHRDGLIAEIEDGTPESLWVEHHLGRPVIKTFNSIVSVPLGDKGLPKGTPGRVALPVAGDHGQAKDTTMALVDALGFDPVDFGAISGSWRQQPGTPCYLADLGEADLVAALDAATQQRTIAWRATPDSPGTFADPK